jgi:hypothetical protein
MQTLMITSVTRHQQCFSTRNTKVKGRNNAALITQGMIEAAWRLPRGNPEIGLKMPSEHASPAFCPFLDTTVDRPFHPIPFP